MNRGLTEAEEGRLSQIVSKALDKSQGSLSEEEIKDLQALIKKLGAIKEAEDEKKASEYTLSEKIDLRLKLSYANKALELNQQKQPFGVRLKALKEEMEQFKNSWAYKEAMRKHEELKQKQADEKFYEEHVKQFGKEL
ncbi:hypothetical protein M1K46_07995 [Fictibacillus sp. WQ 8-8]|uniref:hypothetical protein n=1 Tax=Fictibacillus sp. WQ 8-8 TaxID=2938788 RepID=UPI00210C3D76|nr:hypothetical protein [Fictibacillus sp. WQ 8-8]MCQ6265604.1 hypothetical protein [Fictibacillus sp. WQ 8-8]